MSYVFQSQLDEESSSFFSFDSGHDNDTPHGCTLIYADIVLILPGKLQKMWCGRSLDLPNQRICLATPQHAPCNKVWYGFFPWVFWSKSPESQCARCFSQRVESPLRYPHRSQNKDTQTSLARPCMCYTVVADPLTSERSISK